MTEEPHDPIPLAISSVALSVLLGTAIMSIFLLVNRSMVRGLPANGAPDVNQPAANLLLVGAFATLILPALATWNLLAPLNSAYRRGGLAMVSAFGAILVSLLSMPLNELAGVWGLVGLLAGALVLALAVSRKVLRERRAFP
ncbi:MAG: hypothetical protein ABI613_02565 [Gemmatimonadota bacterium]